MKRFAISRLSSLGDVVCSLPAASALKRGFPGCEVVWLVDQRFAGIVECCSAVDRVVVVDPRDPPTLEGEFDATLDLQGLFKSAWVLRKLNAKQRLGYHWQREFSGWFSSRVLPDPTSLHIVDQYVDVARAAGGQADGAEFCLSPHPEDVGPVSEKLKEAGALGRFVVLNAGAAWVTKRWPPERFAALADRVARAGLTPVFMGAGSADEAIVEEVSALVGRPVANLVGKTSVRELVALVAASQAHVGGDTGSTHIAAALGVPAIGLYSITRPERSCPYGQIERCLYEPTGLANLDVDRVWDKLSAAIA